MNKHIELHNPITQETWYLTLPKQTKVIDGREFIAVSRTPNGPTYYMLAEGLKKVVK